MVTGSHQADTSTAKAEANQKVPSIDVTPDTSLKKQVEGKGSDIYHAVTCPPPHSPCADVRVKGRRQVKCEIQRLHLRHVPEGRRQTYVTTLGLASDRVGQAKPRYHDERSAAKAEALKKVESNEVTSDTSLGRKQAGE